MKEQQAVHTLRAHRAEMQTQGASRHRVGTSSGIHPEDHPFLTNERRPPNRQPVYDDREDEDALYTTRMPNSVRRYASAPATTPPRTIMRVTQHPGPPPMQRASRTYTHPPAYAEPEQAPIHRSMWRVRWSRHAHHARWVDRPFQFLALVAGPTRYLALWDAPHVSDRRQCPTWRHKPLYGGEPGRAYRDL